MNPELKKHLLKIKPEWDGDVSATVKLYFRARPGHTLTEIETLAQAYVAVETAFDLALVSEDGFDCVELSTAVPVTEVNLWEW